MNDPPNPVHRWLRAARQEFGSAEEMKAFLPSIKSDNTRQLLEREAQEWALEELRKKGSRAR
jgi:hypothetical protein